MNIQTTNINLLWGSLLVEELYRQGCCMFFVSPGSRSTPLTVAAARHPHVETQLCVDERAAAFFALGYSRATGRPGVLLCTSGTASANYLPAVIEASVDHVPMIVCSADRPPELLQTGANQTIQQAGLFGSYPRWQTTLPCPTLDISPAAVLTTVDQAVHQASRHPSGPVHLNCMFREPLAPIEQTVPSCYLEPIQAWSQNTTPYTSYVANELRVSQPSLDHLKQAIQHASQGVVLVGRLSSSKDVSSIHAFCDKLGWPVVTDIGSGLRLQHSGWPYLQTHDMLLRQPLWLETHQPDLILHFGGPLISKASLKLLHHNRDTTYIHIHHHPDRIDPLHCVTTRIEANPVLCCEQLLSLLNPTTPSPWIYSWQAIAQTLESLLSSTFSPRPRTPDPGPRTDNDPRPRTDNDPGPRTPDSGPILLSEPSIAYHLSRHLPSHHTLMIGNSMPIRDWDLFATGACESLVVGANRGASGIDGLLATALGMVKGTGTSGTLVLGDLSLIHDLNSLLLLQQTQLPLTVVVINNQGGGIFGFLPIAQFDDVFSSHFTTPHEHTLAPIAKAMGLSASTVSSLSTLLETYEQAVRSGKPSLIEVQTQREVNIAFHREFEQRVAESVHTLCEKERT